MITILALILHLSIGMKSFKLQHFSWFSLSIYLHHNHILRYCFHLSRIYSQWIQEDIHSLDALYHLHGICNQSSIGFVLLVSNNLLNSNDTEKAKTEVTKYITKYVDSYHYQSYILQYCSILHNIHFLSFHQYRDFLDLHLWNQDKWTGLE